MKSTDIVHFLPSGAIFAKAYKIFKTEQRKLRILFPEADIQQVGSSAIPGAIGKFDVNIQIRVTQENFNETVQIMEIIADKKHPELWKPGFAIFHEYSDIIDYVVTIIDSPYDDFHRFRDFLITHPETLKEYNELKASFNGKSYVEYSKAKQTYIGGNGKVRFLKHIVV